MLDPDHAIVINNKASENFTLLEANGPNWPGELYRITRALGADGLAIHSAKITPTGSLRRRVLSARRAGREGRERRPGQARQGRVMESLSRG